MDLDVKIKDEPICFVETSNNSCCEMDQKIEIKEEPVWSEGTTSTSFPSTDIKDEICVDEHTVGQLVACFKEEEKFANVALLTGSPMDTCKSSCKILKEGSEVMCILPTCKEYNIHVFSDSDRREIHPHGCSDHQKASFLEKLEDIIDEENIMIIGDFNAQVGTDRSGYEGINGPYGFGNRNEEVQTDASGKAIAGAGVLLQVYEDGRRPVLYVPRILTDLESK
ncbi:uncharacterized protein [Anabrus simplex]|uniref:uncharacterized protein n=1 Tax=Anabrus simplex TaxID=316456 RepID=UPI0035A39F91